MALFTLYREGYLKFLNSPFILIHFVIFCKIMYFSSLFKWKWSLCNVCLVLNIESWNLMKVLTGLNIWLNAPFNIKIGRIYIYIYIYIYKVLISFVCLSFCLFIFPIITQEPVARFASNFDWGTRETHGNVRSLVLRFYIKWIDLCNESLVSR